MRFLDRKTRTRSTAAAFAALLLLGTSVTPASAEDTSMRRVGEVTFDVVVLRPLWAATFIAGCALLAPAILISAPVGGSDAVRDARESFIDGPYKQAFERPLGEF